MPSWITHLITANKIEQYSEKNEFIFANIMPDILEGHNVKNVSEVIKHYKTHYPTTKTINGISIPLPNIYHFKEIYINKMENPIIKGYYCHLLTDYFWNVYTYQKYFENFDKRKNLVKIKLNNGCKKIVQWKEAVKIKQKDFNQFTNYLKNSEKIIIPFYTEKIKKYSQDLKEFKFTQADIENSIIFIEEIVNSKREKEEGYNIFTKKELIKTLEDSIQWIKEKLKE